MALAVGAGVLPAAAHACAVMSKEGEARRAREQAQWLVEETDLKVRSTFVEEPESADEEDEAYRYRRGIITAADGQRYRISIKVEINCGFPNYEVYDGSRGLFYLKRDEYQIDSDEEDLADGVIDNYTFIHFRPGRGK